MADLTTLDIKTILSLLELLEAVGTEYVAVQETGGDYKRISVDNLKKTFLPYTGAVSDINLGTKNLETTGTLKAAYINVLTSIATDEALTAAQGKVLKDAIDLLNDAVGVAGSVLKSIYDNAQTAAFIPVGGIVATSLGGALGELDAEILLLNDLVGAAGSVLHSIKGHAQTATFTPTGGIIATTLATALAELDVEIVKLNAAVGVAGSVLKMIKDNAQTGTFTPVGGIVAVTIATALAELDTEIVKLNANVSTAGSVLKSIKDNAENATFTPGATGLTANIKDAVLEVNTKAEVNIDDISENTQLIATKDQQNLNQHNSMAKRLAVAESETYNGTDLETFEKTNKVGIATDGTDISASVEDGSVELVSEAKSFENLVDNGDETTSLTSDDDNTRIDIAPDGTWSFNTPYSGAAQLFNITTGHKYYAVCKLLSTSVGTIREIRIVDSAGSTIGSIVDEASSFISDIITASGSDSACNMKVTEDDAGLIYRDYQMLIDLNALGLEAVLTTKALCDSYFNYVNGLASSLPHDVESVGVNLDPEDLEQGEISDTTGLNSVNTIRVRGVGYICIGSIEHTHKINNTSQKSSTLKVYKIYYYDSNFDFISTTTTNATSTTFTPPSNTQYYRYVLILAAATEFSPQDLIDPNIQLQVGASATTYQSHKTNHAHIPVTLNQVPTAEDTFDVRTGVHGVNTGTDIFDGTEVWGSYNNGQGVNSDLSYCRIDALADMRIEAVDGKVIGEDGTYSYGDTGIASAIGHTIRPTSDGRVYVVIPTALLGSDDLAGIVAYMVANPISYIYELADASKYTVQYAPQNLIAYKGGQMSAIPMHRNPLISVGTDVTVDAKVSRVEAIYEYVGGKESLVDSADYSLDATGLIITITGAESGEVYYVVAPYDTSGSTYPTRQTQYTTENVASKVAEHTAYLASRLNAVRLPADVLKAPGSKPATFVEHGLDGAWSFADQAIAGNQEQISGVTGVPYRMDRTVAPTIKMYWSANGSSPGDAKWQLEYLWSSVNEDTIAAAQETLTAIGTASATANGQIKTEIAGVDVPSDIDTLFQFRITRLSADAADTISDTIELLCIEIEFTADKLGETI